MQTFPKILRKNAAYILFFTVYTAAFFLFAKIFRFTFPFVFGTLLSILSLPVCNFFERKVHLSRKVAVLVASLLVFTFIIILFSSLLFWLIIEVHALTENRSYFKYDALSPPVQKFLSQLLRQLPSAENIFQKIVPSIFPSLLPFFGKILRFCISIPALFFIPVLAFLTLYSTLLYRRKLRSMISHWIPLPVLRGIRKAMRKRSGTGLGVLSAYITLYLVTFCESCIIFSLLKTPYPLITAFLACFADCIPVLGPGIIYLALALYSLLCGAMGQALGLLFGWILITIIRQIIEPKLLAQISKTPSIFLFSSIYISLILGNFWPIPYVVLLFFLKSLLSDAGLLAITPDPQTDQK